MRSQPPIEQGSDQRPHLLLILIVAIASGSVGCQHDDTPIRPYSSLIAYDGADLLGAIGQLDGDDDQLVTAADLFPGEAAVILQVSGFYTDGVAIQTIGEGEYLPATDWHATLKPRDDGGVDIRLAIPTSPTAWLALGIVPTADDHELASLTFEAREIEVRTRGDAEASGTFPLEWSDGSVSGWFESGTVHGPLYSDAPDEADLPEITGLSVDVYALAFRDLAVLP